MNMTIWERIGLSCEDFRSSTMAIRDQGRAFPIVLEWFKIGANNLTGGSKFPANGECIE